jgi:thioredoxin reductase
MTAAETDVIIVGAGAAGLSAALMLGRSRRRVLVLDGGAPRNAVSAHMHGVLGRDGWSPLDLVATGREEILRYGVAIESASAVSAERVDDAFAVTLSDGTVRTARRLLVAGGLRDGLPGIAGLAERWGRGVAHCPYCDGWEVRDGRIAVVATGPASVHQAQLVRQLSADVTFYAEVVELGEHDRAGLDARRITVETRRIAAIESSAASIVAVRLADGTSVPTDSVFVRPRAIPADELLHQLGADSIRGVDDHDWVVVDATGRTSVPGLWAAGNVVNPAATVPVSAAAGAGAGTAINADLVDDEVRRAMRANTR